MDETVNKNEVILPFKTNPLMQVTQMKAFELGIIEANEKTIYPWIFNSCINQQCILNDKHFTFVGDRWYANENVTQYQQFCMERTNVDSNSFNILDFIRELIQNGTYIYGKYNEYFIPGKFSYQKQNFAHDFLIYGYSDDKNIFYSSGYQKGRKYGAFVISYSDFLESLRGYTQDQIEFNFIRFKGINNKLDIRKICDNLYDYLHSIFTKRNISCQEKVFGIDCGKIYIQYLKEAFESGEALDIRQCRFFMEMKNLMKERLVYLTENKYIDIPGLTEEYEKVRKNAETAHILSLRYLLEADKAIIGRIITLQEENYKLEYDILTHALHELYKYMNNKTTYRR
jgi:hypothetical protein